SAQAGRGHSDQPPDLALGFGGAASGSGAGMLSLFLALMKREWRLAMRRPGDVLIPLVFFLVVCSLFPLGVGADAALLSKMAPGVLWVSALLATMLSLSRLFEQDEQDGALEQVLFSHLPLSLWVLGKVLAHTFLTGV